VEAEKNLPAPWTTRKGKSKAYLLLYKILMDDSRPKMSVDTLWKSHELFHCYSFQDFTKYHKEMVVYVEKRKALVGQEEADFQHDVELFPRKAKTSRGQPFWDTHPAAKLLHDDIKSGRVASMKPAEIKASRLEYEPFDDKDFTKKVDQERSKQRTAPYWRMKKKKEQRKKLEEEMDQMKESWDLSYAVNNDLARRMENA
jgi:hypothetical protein